MSNGWNEQPTSVDFYIWIIMIALGMLIGFTITYSVIGKQAVRNGYAEYQKPIQLRVREWKWKE